MKLCYPQQSTQTPVVDSIEPYLDQLLSLFQSITLADMESVALLNRTDTKFLINSSALTAILPSLFATYRIVQIKGKRQIPYRNLYFDTENLTLYHQHHNGMLNRHKVRIREYVDSELSFLEVKFKTNKKRTIKNRIRVECGCAEFGSEDAQFLGHYYPHDSADLLPILWNDFTRITLVSKYAKERLTFDIDLRYRSNGMAQTLPGLVIVEVKQERALSSSDFIQTARRLGIRPSKFSKYCMGVSMLFSNVKTNNFKPSTLFVNKLIQRSHHGFQ